MSQTPSSSSPLPAHPSEEQFHHGCRQGQEQKRQKGMCHRRSAQDTGYTDPAATPKHKAWRVARGYALAPLPRPCDSLFGSTQAHLGIGLSLHRCEGLWGNSQALPKHGDYCCAGQAAQKPGDSRQPVWLSCTVIPSEEQPERREGEPSVCFAGSLGQTLRI